MNNYIPFNKAIGPKVLCDGDEALIPQKLGVDEMTFTFDGGSCEHASCAGAPDMFIKVEEEALYHSVSYTHLDVYKRQRPYRGVRL